VSYLEHGPRFVVDRSGDAEVRPRNRIMGFDRNDGTPVYESDLEDGNIEWIDVITHGDVYADLRD
jgi:hypothetical protein